MKIHLVSPLCLLLGACAAVPRLPDKQELPLDRILTRSVCELRGAFLYLEQSKRASFKANSWLISISITPKVNSEITASAGVSTKSSISSAARTISTFALGVAPGAQADLKGHSDGSVAYNVLSRKLLDKSLKFDCAIADRNESILTRNLGLKSWLIDVVTAADGDVENLVKIDKPTFTSEIFVKFNGAGSYTYVFPYGASFASLYGSYDRDEILSVALSPDPTPKVISVRTLPAGGEFGKSKSETLVSNAVVSAQSRLDVIQLQQTLRNLNVNSN